MAKNDGGRVYPSRQHSDFKIKCECGRWVMFDDVIHPGMTRRQWLVGMAMQAILNSPRGLTVGGKDIISPIDVANGAHGIADAILEYEEKEGKDGHWLGRRDKKIKRVS